MSRGATGDSSTSAKGTRGEGIALRHLEQVGYRIITRNYRCRQGEIDIVAEEGGVLCFIEVRSRRSRSCGGPLETVRSHKQQRIIQAARHYLSVHRCWQREIRFDVVGIVLEPALELELVRGAFQATTPW